MESGRHRDPAGAATAGSRRPCWPAPDVAPSASVGAPALVLLGYIPFSSLKTPPGTRLHRHREPAWKNGALTYLCNGVGAGM